ncbi:protein serine/threonine phosphatase 2C [Hysterangium stoloniferum]|nr:protein serine/threonine phosphatase 2C [Hysterangium stoloniferum]
MTFSDSPNARSKTVTIAAGPDTYGALNQHPSISSSYTIGVCEDKGTRRTMEDAYAFVADFANVRGQGYWAIFDGHAGKHAAEWCGQHFHEHLLETLRGSSSSVPEILNQTFHGVDRQLSKLAEDGQTHSGCTAVTAFLRIEDAEGGQNFMHNISPSSKSSSSDVVSHTYIPPHFVEVSSAQLSHLRRVLYTANVGDARAVLCRGGKAIRLTYDHKGSDKQEAKRIMDAGGFVMNNRVNGVLAVTRSLGDSSMKDFVVGAPYTTETELREEDEFLVIACDGLWDVAEDQKVVDLVRNVDDPQAASQVLLRYALEHFTSDNVTVLVVRFKHP